MAREKILVVDDEIEVAELVKDYLEAENFEVLLAFDGEAALRLFHEQKPDFAVLDIMLPVVDGMEICRQIRNGSSIPILMLSSKKSDTDKIISLGLGADDYMTKPFSPGELVARVKAHLRRVSLLSVVQEKKQVLKYGNLEIDLKAYTAAISGQSVSLSAKEFELLTHLALHPNQVFTRDQLFDQVWGFDEYGDKNTITVHIRRIREKLEEDPANPRYVKTVWGVGYKFDGGKG